MKYVVPTLRILLGLIFFIFGLNTILHFIPLPPPAGDALTWMTILVTHGWMTFVGTLMVVSGLLLLVGRFVPLALTLLAPVIVCIDLYHVLLWPHGAAAAVVASVLELALLIAYHRSFHALLAPGSQPDPTRI